jgi:protein TonB
MHAGQTGGYLDARPNRSVALVATVALHAVVIAALLLFRPQFERVFDPGMKIMPVPEAKLLPEPKKLPPPKSPSDDNRPRPEQPKPPIQGSDSPDISGPTIDQWPPLPPLPTQGPIGDGSGGSVTNLPVLVGVSIDPRFAAQLQPPYPASMQRMGVEGSVTVRARIGTDGRVLDVELVRADDPAFFAATREWALRKWRFRPATRDGVVIEGWTTKTVRFVIANAG